MGSYVTYKLTNALTTSSVNNDILIDAFDVSNLDTFTLTYQNNNAAINMSGMLIQAAPHDTTSFTSQADVAPEWVTIATAVIANRANLNALSSFRTQLVDNCYGYLRILGKTATSASAGCFVVRIDGKKL